ncbi:hypothetical protein P9139_03985 [Curtobacterium flaccumfaciens]|nr:hypothetical protein P9139_03985 [Curtobacterium flaccumfaciens]
MVDDHRACSQFLLGRLERGGRGERERVRSAAQRDEHEVPGAHRADVERLREQGADRATGVGDRWVEPGRGVFTR